MINKSRGFSIFFNVLLIFLVLACLVPFWLLIVSSFTSETYLVQNGYSMMPKEFSMAAYNFLFATRDSIVQAYKMSIIIAVCGVTASVVMTILFAYPLSRTNLPGRSFFSLILFFTMLFNGGLVPTYLVYTNLVHVKDTIWAMIVPYLLFNPFLVIMMRTYFTTSIPHEVIEAAMLDGASETQTLVKVVVPMSKPIIATISLMTLIAYWNNWTNGVYFIQTRRDLFGIQNYLNSVISNIAFLQTHSTSSINASQLPSISIRMALAVIAIIPILIAYPFFQKSFVAGITVGSVKG